MEVVSTVLFADAGWIEYINNSTRQIPIAQRNKCDSFFFLGMFILP
jgi:hypothetical protein